MSTSTPTASDAPAVNEHLARPVGRPAAGPLGAALVMIVLVGLGIWSVIDLGISVPTIIGSLGNAVDFAGRMVPLDFPPAGELAAMILETLAIVVLSTGSPSCSRSRSRSPPRAPPPAGGSPAAPRAP